MMKKFNNSFEKKLEQEIAAIEEKTSVEVIVAITPDSDSYIDTYLKGGILSSILVLLFLLYAPLYFSEALVAIDMLAAFAAGALIVGLFPPIKRLLASSKRKERYVKRAANSFFRENELTETLERTAFLVYISVFEKKCSLIGDRGIIDAVPAGELKEIENNFRKLFDSGLPPQRILEALPTLTQPFSKYLPPAEDNIDEISNRLRRVSL
jgi:uncharacterized membrane protein